MYEDRIAIDPAVRHGKPIIRGTRVPLEIILGSLAGGLAVLQGHNVDLHQSCPIVALGIGHISSSLSHLRRSGHHLLGGPQALADESRRGGLGSSGYLRSGDCSCRWEESSWRHQRPG